MPSPASDDDQDGQQHPAPRLTVKLAGAEVEAKTVFSVVVETDMDQPDMATLVIDSIKGSASSTVKLGDDLKVLLDRTEVFVGEVVGIEPTFDSEAPARCTLRAFNRLHRLTHSRKSRTFENMTDQDVVRKICQEHNLTAVVDSAPKIKHEHLYQHEESDLHFIRQRASRLAFEVLVDDKKLYFRRRRTQSSSGLKFTLGDGTLVRFRPRLAGGAQVSSLTVRWWDPVKRQEIIGKAQSQSELGGTAAARAAAHGSVHTVVSNLAVRSKEEADALAKSLLREREMAYVTGDAEVASDPQVKAGQTVEIAVEDPRFDGKYYVTSSRIEYLGAGGGGSRVRRRDGLHTYIKVARDSQSPGEAQAESEDEELQASIADQAEASGG